MKFVIKNAKPYKIRLRKTAGGGTRTHTPLRITDFESVSSANSDTPALLYVHYTTITILALMGRFVKRIFAFCADV